MKLLLPSTRPVLPFALLLALTACATLLPLQPGGAAETKAKPAADAGAGLQAKMDALGDQITALREEEFDARAAKDEKKRLAAVAKRHRLEAEQNPIVYQMVKESYARGLADGSQAEVAEWPEMNQVIKLGRQASVLQQKLDGFKDAKSASDPAVAAQKKQVGEDLAKVSKELHEHEPKAQYEAVFSSKPQLRREQVSRAERSEARDRPALQPSGERTPAAQGSPVRKSPLSHRDPG